MRAPREREAVAREYPVSRDVVQGTRRFESEVAPNDGRTRIRLRRPAGRGDCEQTRCHHDKHSGRVQQVTLPAPRGEPE